MKKILSIFCVMLISINVFAQNLPKLNLGGAKKNDSAISNDSSLNRGENLTLAVRTPEGKNLNTSNQWILQYLQDSLTGKMAKYSKMKIVDRSNEKMIMAEQAISGSSETSEDNMIEFGKITNAKLVVVGTVQQLSTGFEINLRINDVETNEIKSSYSNRVTLSDIENGEVVNACILEFFNSLGVELSESETATLKVTNKKENNAVKALAKGDSAQKNGNAIEAMSYFVDAQKSESTKNLASKGITKIFNGKLATNDLKSQIEWQKSETERWKKILNDCRKYERNNLYIIVYDFSETSMELKNNRAYVTVKPGFKIFMNRKTMEVIHSVWQQFRTYKSQNNWINLSWYSKYERLGYEDSEYLISGVFANSFAILDETGYKWKNSRFRYDGYYTSTASSICSSHTSWNPKNQKGIFNDAPWRALEFTLNEKEISEVNGELSIKWTETNFPSGWNGTVYTLEEWNEYLKSLE